MLTTWRARARCSNRCAAASSTSGRSAPARSMKLAINLPLLVYWQALGEALLLMQTAGPRPRTSDGYLCRYVGRPQCSEGTRTFDRRCIERRGLGPVTFDVDSMRKDLQTMIEEGRALGGTLPVTARALECFDQASRDGLGKRRGSSAGTLGPPRQSASSRSTVASTPACGYIGTLTGVGRRPLFTRT